MSGDTEKQYTVYREGKQIETDEPGNWAGYGPGEIFGTLDCGSGKNMNKENRVFFAKLVDAAIQGFRPCKNCRPVDYEDFQKVYDHIPEDSYEDWKDYLEYIEEWEEVEENSPRLAEEVESILED